MVTRGNRADRKGLGRAVLSAVLVAASVVLGGCGADGFDQWDGIAGLFPGGADSYARHYSGGNWFIGDSASLRR